ncbi:MAG: amidohydrolase family protein [Rhodobacteraceae bacterium]|nr:amidohydrolase family protein [Paracoccaceae bacterium]
MTAPRIIPDVLVPACFVPTGEDFGRGAAGGHHGDMVLRNGRVAGLRPRAQPAGPDTRLVLPALTEAHCHLDKCHTVHRLPAVGGDLAAAIAAQGADKVRWSAEDLADRAARGLREAAANGCAALRSHVDWGDAADPPLAWRVLGDAARQVPGVALNRAALTGADALARDGWADAVARAIAPDAGTLGAFVLDQPDRALGVRAAFAAADRYGLALDFHVDEGLAQGLNGLEMIADTALDTGFQGPVLCGHACSLMNVTGADLARILDKLARAGITVCALPTTNLYLQGRGAGTPDRRGLTRLREMRAAGVAIAVGSDNVADAFCPVGAHDPMAALHLAVLTGHLDPPFDRWLGMVTTDAARALGHAPTMVPGAHIRDLRISDASDIATLISGRAGALAPLPQPQEI